MQHLKIGHYTNPEQGTGLSVFLFDRPAIGSYYICGSAPATRELHILDLDSNASHLNGLVLTGGSAFGLGAADGVMRFLCEKGLGVRMPHGGVVPIVPTAAIYDLAVASPHPPTAEDAYQACLAADEKNISRGRIGAGTGASVGKLIPNSQRMSGGLGHAKIELDNGVIVSAYAVVNAVGDVRDNTGNILAGARMLNSEFGNSEKFLLNGGREPTIPEKSNTTLIAIFTNATFSKSELRRIAKMAAAGMARAISPAFTRYDGDIIFCVSLGDSIESELTVGVLAADVTQNAIINAVKESVIL